MNGESLSRWRPFVVALSAGLATALAREAPPSADPKALWAFLSVAAMMASGAMGGARPTALCAVVALACGLGVVHVRLDGAFAVGALGGAIALLSEHGGRARARAAAAARRLRERDVHLQSILDTAPEGMVVFDARGVIRAFGAAAERQFGWTAAEAIGADVECMLPSAFSAAVVGQLEARTAAGVRRDGSTFALELSLAQSDLGRRRFFTAFIREPSAPAAASTHINEACAGDDEITLRLARLSARERQVLEGIVAGQPNKTIAFDLSISPRTVEIYRAKLMAKMEARSLPELVRMTLSAGA